MSVAIGSVLLLVASFLLGAVIVLAGFGIILLLGSYFRKARRKTARGNWEHGPGVIADRTGTSFVAPRK
jgi:hypothetical protein